MGLVTVRETARLAASHLAQGNIRYKIIAYRQEHGGFKTVEDLKNVDGFGDKTVAKIKDRLAV